jgi:hypothetical protein
VRELREALRNSESEARDAARTAAARQIALEAAAATAEARAGEVNRRLAAAEAELQRKAALVQVFSSSRRMLSIHVLLLQQCFGNKVSSTRLQASFCLRVNASAWREVC